MTLRSAWLAGALLAAAVPGGRAAAQTAGSAEMARRISVKFDGVDLATALTRLRTVFRVPLAFSTEAIPEHRDVNLTAIQEPVADVLAQMLLGTGLHVIPLEGGALVIASPAVVRNTRQKPVWIIGCGEATKYRENGGDITVSAGSPPPCASKRLRSSSLRSLVVLAVVSITWSAQRRKGAINSRSRAMPSLAGRSRASGWRRRVSE